MKISTLNFLNVIYLKCICLKYILSALKGNKGQNRENNIFDNVEEELERIYPFISPCPYNTGFDDIVII